MDQNSNTEDNKLSFEQRKQKVMLELSQGGHDIASIPKKTVYQGEGDDYSSSDQNEYNPRYTPNQ